MFNTLKTLVAGANARSEEKVRDIYSIELIDQKIREAQAGLKAAKFSLASLIQRERAEIRQIEILQERVADLSTRAVEAINGKREDLAAEAAQAIADMENEVSLRQETVSRLATRIIRLRQSVETAHRRIIDQSLKGIAATAPKREEKKPEEAAQPKGQQIEMFEEFD